MSFFHGLDVVKLSALGLSVGVLGALFGVGGGVIMVPALVVIAGLTQKGAQGISLAVMVPMALMGFWRYYKMPEAALDMRLVLLLAVFAIIGANVGSLVVGTVSNRQLQAGFGVLLSLMGGYMVYRSYRG